MSKNKLRIAIVISHPIQHFCPQYASFTQNGEIELKVFFASSLGYKKFVDVDFNQEISWGNLNLDKFEHAFLNGDVLLQPDKNIDAPSLNQSLDDYKPDIIFIYGYFQKLQRRAKRWALKNKVKIAYISDSELRHKEKFMHRFLKSIFLNYYFSRINFFLTVGNANEEYYKSYGVPESKMIRMHYPIDFLEYSNSYNQKEVLRNSMREQYNIPANETVLTVVGKLVRWKNQDQIIEAMKLLEKEGIVLTLFILGSGEMKENWQCKAKELKFSKVYFPGFIKIEELPSFYASTDIYIHPASLEPHSVAISEAIMMGCPIILSDCCGSYGNTDDVQQEKNGYVFEFGNIEALAQMIKLLWKDEQKRKEFGKYSHNIAVQFQQKSHSGVIHELLEHFKSDS
jgi:glycosyltransferase involved in cell wall biosynthesis